MKTNLSLKAVLLAGAAIMHLAAASQAGAQTAVVKAAEPRADRGAASAATPAEGTSTPSSVGQSTGANAVSAGSVSEEIQEIVVTGSQIRGVAPVGSSMIGLSRDAISRVPAISTTDVLRQVPQIQALGPDDTGGRGSVQGAQQNRTRGSSVNLRGIGPNATLLLVNGHRLSPAGYNGTFADPTVIATEAIERIEIVADGASAIYGSDAIAGVVNFVLRKKYDGLRASVQYGGADGFNQSRASVVGGTSWSSGSVVFTYEYNRRGSLLASERSFYTSDLRPYGGPDRRSPFSVPGNVSVGGVNYAIPAQDGKNLTATQLAAGRGITNRSDLSGQGEVFPKQTRNNVTVAGEQKLTDNLKILFDGFWFQRDFRLRAVPMGTITVSSNPAAANYSQFFKSPVPGVTTGTVNYNFFNDVGLVQRDGYARQYEANLALELKLPGDWRATLGGTYGRTRELERFDDFFSTYSGYVNPLLRDPDPNTALNLFGVGGNNKATLAKLNAEDGRGTTKASLADINLKVDGSLFTLPAGDVKVAIGFSHRRETQSLLQTSSNNASLTVQPTINIDGSRRVEAAFVEAFVPLIGRDSHVPLIYQLDLSLAARGEKYSDFGRTINPKVGVNWKPVAGVNLRGSYGRSFRAPALNFKNPIGTVLPPVSFIPDPTSPTGTTPGIVFTGGNPNTGPERARTFSLGADLQPEGVRGLTASVNFFDVLYTDKIGQAGGGGSSVALSQEAFYRPYIERNPSVARVLEILANAPAIPPGSIDPTTVKVLIDGRANNIGKAKIQGLDFTLAYRFDAGPVTVELGESGTYYTRYKNATTLASPYLDVLNTINWPTRWRSQTRVFAQIKGLTATGFLNYVPSYQNNQAVPAERVKSFATVDMQISYDTGATGSFLSRDMTISLNVTNLFNKKPPYVNNPSGVAFDPQQASPIRRLITVQVAKKFW